ncbi:MAG: hypothetical protein FJ096_08765 [Deltaproteobacteria bacterium]|nr:hypothetical protein [Deltaproteobacteria bacterium]
MGAGNDTTASTRAAGASAPVPAAAPPASSAEPTAEGRSTEFRAVEGGAEMQSGTALLTEAYAAIWLLALGLVLLGMRKLRRLEARLDGLSSEIARARADQAKKG